MSAAAPWREARVLARRLRALEEGPLRARAAARWLAAEPPQLAAALLEGAVRLARDGEPALASALAGALLHPLPDLSYEHLSAIYAAAADAGLEDARALLVGPAPRRAWSPPRDQDSALAELSLGHKKALARGRGDPDLLARLAAEGDPTVVRELLQNPRLTEALVVRIAARRPCRPEVLRAVASSRRWRTQPAVARAIAHNPYAEPELVLKLLPSLAASVLAAIADDPALHGAVRASARRLAGSRGGG